jgi:hypothetical protein
MQEYIVFPVGISVSPIGVHVRSTGHRLEADSIEAARREGEAKYRSTLPGYTVQYLSTVTIEMATGRIMLGDSEVLSAGVLYRVMEGHDG